MRSGIIRFSSSFLFFFFFFSTRGYFHLRPLTNLEKDGSFVRFRARSTVKSKCKFFNFASNDRIFTINRENLFIFQVSDAHVYTGVDKN